MAVLKKIRTRLFSAGAEAGPGGEVFAAAPEGVTRPALSRYDIRPLTVAQLDECWRLDQRCFIDGEAYSRETFEYLLTSADSVSYRAVTAEGSMVGFIVGLVEPEQTGHITTLGVAPEHRRPPPPPPPRPPRSPLHQHRRAGALRQTRLRRHPTPPPLLLQRRRRPDDGQVADIKTGERKMVNGE